MRAEAFAAEGMMGKATAVFKGERPAPVDATTTADMKAKHPVARPSEAARCGGLRPVAGAAALAARPEEVIRGVKKFPRGLGGRHVGPKAPAPQRRPRPRVR